MAINRAILILIPIILSCIWLSSCASLKKINAGIIEYGNQPKYRVMPNGIGGFNVYEL